MLIGESANFKRNRGTSACIRKRDAHLWEMVADQVIDAPSEWMPLGAFLNIEEFHRAKYDNGGREKKSNGGGIRGLEIDYRFRNYLIMPQSDCRRGNAVFF